MKDLFSGGLFTALTVAFLISAQGIEDPGYDVLGPAFLPKLVLWPMLGLSLWLLVRGIVALARPGRVRPAGDGPDLDAAGATDTETLRKQAVLAAMFSVFVAVVVWKLVPFWLSGAVFCVAAGFLLAPRHNRRLYPWIIGCGILLPVALDYLFKTHLYVNLP